MQLGKMQAYANVSLAKVEEQFADAGSSPRENLAAEAQSPGGPSSDNELNKSCSCGESTSAGDTLNRHLSLAVRKRVGPT